MRRNTARQVSLHLGRALALALAAFCGGAVAEEAPSAAPPPDAAPGDAIAPAETIAPADAPVATDAAGAGADGVIVVAVLDLKASGGAEASAAALTTMLTAEVASIPGHRGVSRNELRSILAHQADARMAGCEAIECMGDVARLVQAQRVLMGEVSKLEGATALSLTLVDTSGAEPRIAARQEAAWRGREDELLLLARPLVQRLLDAHNAAQHVGGVELFAVDGATIVLDGKAAGTTPLAAPLRGLPTGVHTLQLSKDGYQAKTVDIVVARNENTVARVDLEELALTDRPWFWVAAGGIVLLAGGTAAGVTTWAVISQPQPTQVTLGKTAP